MTQSAGLRAARQFLSTYGMLAVLALLCVFFAWATVREEHPTGAAGAEALADSLRRSTPGSTVAIVAQDDAEGAAFAGALRRALPRQGLRVVLVALGDPPRVRRALEAAARRGERVDVVATTRACADWTVFGALRRLHPDLGPLEVKAPPSRQRSVFLSPNNLRNIADQIAVIAIIAVGMTLVIITGGIDLSVGSLVALSAVTTAWLVRQWGGGTAGTAALLGASLAAIALCGLVGAFSGLVITRFGIPPFIATLAMMQVASGAAFIVAQGQSIYDIPASFTWLGRRADLLSLPNAVVLMLLIYLGAQVLMSRTALGSHLYAVGGNREASRLSGVPVARVVLFAYAVSGLMAGVGGVVTASQLKAGAPTYGLMYELYVIAAVVVGGTSLSGGEGKVFGTLIGAFIIAVIRNGMNLMNVEPYTQKVVLGLVILGAVLIDQLKRVRWRRRTAAPQRA